MVGQRLTLAGMVKWASRHSNWRNLILSFTPEMLMLPPSVDQRSFLMHVVVSVQFGINHILFQLGLT